MAIDDHVLGIVRAVVASASLLGSILGGFLRWILRNEHRLSRLEQAVFGKDETPT